MLPSGRALEIVPRIRAVERFVAQREVGDDVAFDGGFEQRPLKPGWIAQVAARDLAARRSAPRRTRRRGNLRLSPSLRCCRRSFGGRRSQPRSARPAVARRICSISDRLCSTSRMRTQTRALTSPSAKHRDGEFELIVGRIAGRLARIEDCVRWHGRHSRPRRTDSTSSARTIPVADGPVLQRGGVVVELDERRKPPPYRPPAELRIRLTPSDVEIGGDAAGHDAIHHQAMAEARGGRAQHLLAQDPAMRMHDARTRRRCRSRRCRRSDWPAARARPSAPADDVPAAAVRRRSAASTACANAIE